MWTLLTFLAFTLAVAVITYFGTRKSDHSSETGFFLAGRTLTFPFIAGSLLLTNLSTEQMVGLNGSAFSFGFSVFAWEVVAVIALVVMAIFFLPRFLKSGIATVPQFLELRFNTTTSTLTNLIFLAFYMIILMPILLYTGSQAIIDIFSVKAMVTDPSWGVIADMFNSSIGDLLLLFIVGTVIAAIGALYALWGGLKAVAVSDTLNGIGLLVGGFLIVYFAYMFFGRETIGEDATLLESIRALPEAVPGRFNSLGGATSEVPAGTILTGVLLINIFYWCTNQQIIQRTFAAKSLSEGQKGVLLCGGLKLLGPLYLVLPGIIAYALYSKGLLDIPLRSSGDVNSAAAYGTLVNTVLPDAWRGFFAAALLGAVLSSYNSCLNSICTMYSLGIYKKHLRPQATEDAVVKSGQVFGWFFVVITLFIAPVLSLINTTIFDYLQNMNSIYFIPILAVVVVGMLSRRAPAISANITLVAGVMILAAAQIIPDFFAKINLNGYHFAALIFLILVGFMLVMAKLKPREVAYVQEDVKAVSMEPWKGTRYVGALLLLVVFTVYATMADTSVLKAEEPVAISCDPIPLAADIETPITP